MLGPAATWRLAGKLASRRATGGFSPGLRLPAHLQPHLQHTYTYMAFWGDEIVLIKGG